jgi:hypothetical protein
MGCGDSKEKIEDEMIKLKFQRTQIQMERKKQIKLLEEIEKKKITEPIIPDYICLQQEKPAIKKDQTEEKRKPASDKKVRIKEDKKKKRRKKKAKTKAQK